MTLINLAAKCDTMKKTKGSDIQAGLCRKKTKPKNFSFVRIKA